MLATVWGISDTTTFQELALLLSPSESKSFYCFILRHVEALELNTEPLKNLEESMLMTVNLPFGLCPYRVSSDFLKIGDNVWFVK
jgi:hypothetical protein